ncbi:MAG: signal recognition particle-docking protein FtsY [Fidelibacterota bacterium]
MPSTGFSKLFDALIRTRRSLSEKMRILTSTTLTRESVEELEALLLGSDVGVPATERIIRWLQTRSKGAVSSQALRDYLTTLLTPENGESRKEERAERTLILVVGVNGTGKTTTAAKLAFTLKKRGHTVLLIGADTYRAAGVAQLKGWATMTGVKLVCNESSRDPSAVLFDGLRAAQAGKFDTAIADTAGRLHTSRNLMNEVEKMHRVATERFPEFAVLTYLTIDANLGQNSLVQAQEFQRILPLDGIVLTKMDGTAKGGIIFSIVEELGVPVKYLGVGETVEDLVEFDPEAYVSSLLGTA